MKTANANESLYFHPHSRWFKQVPKDLFEEELRKTYKAMGVEFGSNHPVTLIAGSWAALGACYSFDSWPLPLLMDAEPVLRRDVEGNRYALACNLAAQGFSYQVFDDPSPGRELFKEALRHARLSSEMHPMDVFAIVEVLAQDLNWSGLRQEAIDLLRSYRHEIAEQFAEFPNECYDLLGLWIEFVGDADDELLALSAEIEPTASSRDCKRAVSKAVVALARAARKAHLNEDFKAASCHFECAVTTLMASPNLRAGRGGALASMLATEAAKQHPTQRFYVGHR